MLSISLHRGVVFALIVLVCLSESVSGRVASRALVGPSGKRVMPWFCLERCGGNASTVISNLNELATHLNDIKQVSFEAYNIGPNGTLVSNFGNLSDIRPILNAFGVELFPMISSYPYPPQLMDWLRQLFDNQTLGSEFVLRTLSEAAQNNYMAYNIDWEPSDPTNPATPEDGVKYASFLDSMAIFWKQFNPNATLTVDVATWSPLWNFTLLAQTAVKTLITMSTYTSNFTSFQSELEFALTTIPLTKLGVGLSTLNTHTNEPLTEPEVAERFDLLMKKNVQEIDIWSMPLPDFWWKYIEKFLAS